MKSKYALLLSGSLLLGGCQIFDGFFDAIFSPTKRAVAQGYTSLTDFPGLADKSVAIVVYAPRATLDEFTGTREEITAFIVNNMREHMPTTRLLDPRKREVINFQDDTLNWASLPERDIGKHFSVDKVLMIEVLDYSTRRLPGHTEMQGRLRAQVHITDCGPNGSDTPEWRGVVDVKWPPDRALDPAQNNEAAVRLRLLEAFADRLVRSFYAGRAEMAIPG